MPTLSHRFRVTVFAGASFLALALPNLAFTQTGYPHERDERLVYDPPKPSYDELKKEYDSIHIWGPAVGIPVSYFTVGAGFGMILGAQIDFDFCFTEAPCEPIDDPTTRRERAIMGAGGVVMALGVAGLVASSIRLHRKNERRRELRWRMKDAARSAGRSGGPGASSKR